jgi:hypothetical protein
MKSASLARPLALVAIAALSTAGPAAADERADILAAIHWAEPVVGKRCDFSRQKAGDMTGAGSFDIRYRYAGQDEDEADQRFALLQLPCRVSAGNAMTLYLTRTEATVYRILSFAEPKLDYDYTDETFAALSAPPRIAGYAATSELANATYDPTSKTISMKIVWGGGAWSAGTWTFVDGQFLLARFSVNPIHGATRPSQTYQIFPTFELKK